jgi:hypothetical protein
MVNTILTQNKTVVLEAVKVCARIRVFVSGCVCVCISVYVYACTRVRSRTCVRVYMCVRACMHASITIMLNELVILFLAPPFFLTHVHVYVHVHTHIRSHTFETINIHTCMYSYMHTLSWNF